MSIEERRRREALMGDGGITLSRGGGIALRGRKEGEH